MSREILQSINKTVTKAADIAAHPFDTDTQRTLRQWQKQEKSLEGKPNGNAHPVIPHAPGAIYNAQELPPINSKEADIAIGAAVGVVVGTGYIVYETGKKVKELLQKKKK